MAKNLIVCADGTGNRGGYTPDSNVYKIYKAIDIHVHGQGGNGITEQRRFYDNGVGTSTNKIWRGLTGAFGIGFARNVCDLYRFLARNHDPGDHIYMFGFSRGAATVRALNGFIYEAGLVKRSVNGHTLSDKQLDDAIDDAYRVYKRKRRALTRVRERLLGTLGMKVPETPEHHGAVPVEFIGVWDTVSALGFPDRWGAVPGILSPVLNTVFNGLEHVLDTTFPHQFYNYGLTENVDHACHALAIDDERLSFRPRLWYEDQYRDARKKAGKPAHVEQVWFAGAHSNVGGGYGRSGLANVSLEWMMQRADATHLVFVQGAKQQAHDEANANGRLFDSRDGPAIYYRYHPRDIRKLCQGRAPVRIHSSAFERMGRATAGYAPGNLPKTVTVVGTKIGSGKARDLAGGAKDAWNAATKQIGRWTFVRKWLYAGLLDATILLIGFSVWTWTTERPVAIVTASGAIGLIVRGLAYVTPKFMENTIVFVVIDHPWIGLTAVAAAVLFWFAREFTIRKLVAARSDLRNAMMDNLDRSAIHDGHDGPHGDDRALEEVGKEDDASALRVEPGD